MTSCLGYILHVNQLLDKDPYKNDLSDFKARQYSFIALFPNLGDTLYIFGTVPEFQ